MVKIPELAEDGKNWKIYHTKFLEVAATYDCLKVLAGRPYKGEDWDGCNALLCCTFMESVPPSIYFKIHCRIAHENFKYLTKRFHNNNPIPHTNELQCAGTATVVEMPEKSPMSTDAATEQLAHANSDVEDLSNSTKALTRGTEDTDDGSVRCIQDPRMSYEASAKGTSANCAETTLVILKGVPHEMQNLLQDSLPLTPRPPIDGKPCECKQEAADSVMTAGRTNGTAQLAKPTEIADINLEKAALGGEPVERASGVEKGGETGVDIDRMAMLGTDPAERACTVDEGAEMECKGTQLQQTTFYCEESRQRNGNANEDIPSIQKLPLKGEWTVLYVNGELLTTTVEPYVDDGEPSTCIHLRGMHWCMGNANRSGCRADMPRGWMDTLSVSNRAEMDRLGHSDNLGTYLRAGDAKCVMFETEGIGHHVDVSSVPMDGHSVKMDATKPANETGNVRTCRTRQKTGNSPKITKMAMTKPIH